MTILILVRTMVGDGFVVQPKVYSSHTKTRIMFCVYGWPWLNQGEVDT
jgi:hypothetical protein